jgi:hypothetical protein
MTHRTRTIAALVATGALALPATALAGEASVQGYATPAGAVQGEVAAGAPSGPASTPAPKPARTARTVQTTAVDELPFTGFDVVLVALAGLFLAGFGVALRRLSHAQA